MNTRCYQSLVLFRAASGTLDSEPLPVPWCATTPCPMGIIPSADPMAQGTRRHYDCCHVGCSCRISYALWVVQPYIGRSSKLVYQLGCRKFAILGLILSNSILTIQLVHVCIEIKEREALHVAGTSRCVGNVIRRLGPGALRMISSMDEYWEMHVVMYYILSVAAKDRQSSHVCTAVSSVMFERSI